MFLLDSNMLIYLFREQGRVFENMDRVPRETLRIPMLVFYELQVGIAKSTAPQRQTRQLGQLMEKVTTADFDRKAALAAAQVRARLEQQGRSIGPINRLIAGTAISLEATLVTHNTGEFSRVEGLNLVDWF